MSHEAFTIRHDSDPEDRIADLLDDSHLPNELKKNWEAANHRLPARQRLASLLTLIERRKEVLSSPTSKTLETPRMLQVTGEAPLAIQRTIESMHKGGHELVGEGKSAQVIASLRDPSICYKVFFEPGVQPPGVNDIAIEADIQYEIYKLGEVAGVRVPRIHYFIADQKFRAIAMERLHAISIQDVLQGRELLPESFQFDTFFKSLAEYMKMLHDNNFYHRDLHDGNIMIDRATGQPYVIDFGFTVKSTSDEGVYRPEIVRSGRKEILVLLSDAAGITSVQAALAKHLRKTGNNNYVGK